MGWSVESGWGKRGLSAWLLSPLGGLYAIGWWSYQSVYSLGLKRAFRPRIPVVTIGNLIAGGAGKTPVTIYVAKVLSGAGRPVVVSMSGYGFRYAQGATQAPEGPLNALDWGDEPALMRDNLPHVPIIVGRDRVAAAKLTESLFPDHILLLDDGFQHLRLHQNISLILDPGMANSFCLPAGPYREPRCSGLARCTESLPGKKFTVRTETRFLSDTPDESIQVLTAIARPERLIASLEALGFRVGKRRFLPDHDPLTAGTLFDEFEPADPLVVTEKDWVKLKARQDIGQRRISVVTTVASIEPCEEFQSWLMRRLDEIGR